MTFDAVGAAWFVLDTSLRALGRRAGRRPCSAVVARACRRGASLGVERGALRDAADAGASVHRPGAACPCARWCRRLFRRCVRNGRTIAGRCWAFDAVSNCHQRGSIRQRVTQRD